ncbi:hypothetical protein [Streptococcus sp. zg-JUN1979]|uniref:hypothetical protein n=1 Tax=Streptococcus sp. zg-JUN1979 TaxID=3391450 RepID=UPI0039A749F9
MFQITNQTTNQTKDFKTRDNLLSFLSEQSVWLDDRRDKASYDIYHVTEDGEVLEKKNLTLPYHGMIEEVFEGFGLIKPKKKNVLLNKLKKSNSKDKYDQSSKEEDKQAHRMSVSEPPKDEKAHINKKEQKGLGFVSILSLILSLSALASSVFTYYQTQSHGLASYKLARIQKDLSLQEQSGRLEVFGRFFLANYFAENGSDLSSFLSDSLKKEGLASPEGVIQSVFYEEAKADKGKINVSLLVSVKEDDRAKTQRMILSVKKDTKAKYGYVLVEQPQILVFG